MSSNAAIGGIAALFATIILLDFLFLGVLLPMEEPFFELLTEHLSS
jgi:hypothetical protein